MKRTTLLACALAAGVAAARADVTLAPVFSDHAVLQRDKPVPVWGRAGAREEIAVEFRGQKLRTVADTAGRWRITLAPLAASADGSELIVRGKNTITLRDVVVGEVWLCAGQSNMEFPLGRARDARQEVANANFPLIRELRINHAVADTRQEDAQNSGWRAASPAVAEHFTAIGYFFARELYDALGRVPVGLIDNARGGSPIESWLSAGTLASDPAFAVVGERWAHELAEYPGRKPVYDAALTAWTAAAAAAKKTGEAASAVFKKDHPAPVLPKGPGHYWTPSGLYNAMFHPLVPVALRGVLWYQGESNLEHTGEYRRLLAALVTSWRTDFAQGEISFFLVQLPNYIYPNDKTGMTLAWLREAQTQSLALPNTAQAVTIDVGDPDEVHPTNKRAVGHRLALLAETRVYGRSVEDSGPMVAGATREGGAWRVRLTHAAGLNTPAGGPHGFEVAGADRQFHSAAVTIEGDTLLVTSPLVPEPLAVRYAWRNAPVADLYNAAGLPAAPFRSDNW